MHPAPGTMPTGPYPLVRNCQPTVGFFQCEHRNTHPGGLHEAMPCLTVHDTKTTLPVTQTAASSARAFTKETLAQWNLSESEETAILLVSELVSNVIRHARGKDGSLQLHLRSNADALRIEVSDSDPRLPEPRTPGDLDESGFGLVLIEALSAKWGSYRDCSGKTVWAEVTTQRHSASRDDLRTVASRRS